MPQSLARLQVDSFPLRVSCFQEMKTELNAERNDRLFNLVGKHVSRHIFESSPRGETSVNCLVVVNSRSGDHHVV